MATDLERLVVSLEANISKYEKTLAKAQANTDAAARGIENRFKKINIGAADNFLNSFSKGLLGAAAGALALEQSITRIRAAIGEIDDLGDMAERIGMSTDAIQALRHTLGQAGGDAEMADAAFDKFADSVTEAALGSGYLAKLFVANGVALRDTNGTLRETEALLVEFARLVANAETPAERLKLATDAFGRKAGPKMVGTLLEIANKGMPALIQSAKDLGVVLDKDAIEKASELDKAFRKVEEQASKAFKQMVVDWGGPVLLAVIKGLEIAVKNFALSFELIKTGRVREALGLISRFEAAKQRMTIGAEGTQLTQAEMEKSFYGVVGRGAQDKTPGAPAALPEKKTVIPPAKTTAARIDDFEREIEQTQKSTAAIELETQTIDLNTYARENAKKTLELETAAKQANKEAGKANTEVTAEQRAIIIGLADAYARARVAAEEATGPMRSFIREAKDSNKALQEASVAGLRSFEDALVGIVTGTTSVADAFKKMADSIIADLVRIAIRKAIIGPLAEGLFGAAGGGGATLNATPWAFPKFADGTSNAPGGLAVVGEKGPELMNVPKGSQIIPNSVLRKGGGAIVYSPAIDARGASVEAVARLAQIMEADRASFASRTVQTIQQARRGRIPGI